MSVHHYCGISKKVFSHLSVLYLENSIKNLDEDLFQNFRQNEGLRQVNSVNSDNFLTLLIFCV